MKKVFKRILAGIAVALLVGVIYGFSQFRDRHPGYELNLVIAPDTLRPVRAGFAKIDITPQGFDTWNDANGDARYNEKDGDTYNDLNGNGKFDAVWLAGFHQGRPANGVNDPLWARTMVIDDGRHRIGLCVIDMMGFGHDDVITTRKRIKETLGLDYVIIASTHVHSSPDLMGMWGPSPMRRGTDEAYLEEVIDGIVASFGDAVAALRPARLKFAENLTDALPLVGDSRPPQVFDAGIRLMQAIDLEKGNTLGTFMNWGNHPETLWSGNVMLTSDFPHYYRTYLEEGIYQGDSLIQEGVGGIALFANGAVGGLMTTRPPDTIPHPLTKELITGATFQKAEAQGMALALLSLNALRSHEAVTVDASTLALQARTISLKMENKLFRLAGFLGIFRRGYHKRQHLRSEVAAWSIGPAAFVHVPGELYPEILNGGVESPEGGDYGLAPVESPAIRELMSHRFKFFVGLSNDEIGYIVPKSQWDTKAPFTYGRDKAPYGEVNSLGPETAPVIYQHVKEILKELNP
jgi:hypothetical protein